MFSDRLDNFVASMGVTVCCYCLPHRRGVRMMGVGFAITALLSLALSVIWLVHLRDYKQSFLTFLACTTAFHLVVVACSLALSLGARKNKKEFLIPWLVLIKFMIVCLGLLSGVIIYLEVGRFFTVGTTVFGLLSIVALFAASVLIYYWIIVRALYMRYERNEFTTYEVHPYPKAASVVRPSNGGLVNQGFSCSRSSLCQASNGGVNPAWGDGLPPRPRLEADVAQVEMHVKSRQNGEDHIMVVEEVSRL